MHTPDREVLLKLAESGLLSFDGETVRTTRRWQGAMMRAIQRHLERGEDQSDLRYVIAEAMIEIHGSEYPEDALCAEIEALTFVELEQLQRHAQAKQSSAPAGG